MGATIRSHHAILQRLDTPVDYGTHSVIHSRGPFVESAQYWENIPVVYADATITKGHHPSFDDVDDDTLPKGYTVVGHIHNPIITGTGAYRLEADVDIDDKYSDVADLANAGGLALSTAFSCQKIQCGKDKRRHPLYSLRGQLRPNHVLLFRQGATPDCYGRDNAAMFVNSAADTGTAVEDDEIYQESVTMDSTTELRGIRGLLQSISDKIGGNRGKVEDTCTPQCGSPEPIAQMTNVTADPQIAGPAVTTNIADNYQSPEVYSTMTQAEIAASLDQHTNSMGGCYPMGQGSGAMPVGTQSMMQPQQPQMPTYGASAPSQSAFTSAVQSAINPTMASNQQQSAPNSLASAMPQQAQRPQATTLQNMTAEQKHSQALGQQVAQTAVSQQPQSSQTAGISAEDYEKLKQELEGYRAERALQQWTQIKSFIPAGWLSQGDNVLRAEYEANKDAFYLRILAHNAQFTNSMADGNTSAPAAEPTGDAALLAEIDRINKKYRWN